MKWVTLIVIGFFISLVFVVYDTLRKSEKGLFSTLLSEKETVIGIPLIITFLLFIGSIIIYALSGPPSVMRTTVQVEDALTDEPIENAEIFLSYQEPSRENIVPQVKVGETNIIGTTLVTIPTKGQEKFYLISSKEGFYPDYTALEVKPLWYEVWKWMPQEIPSDIQETIIHFKME